MVDNEHVVHGVTKFSDWSVDEFRSRLLTLKPSSEAQKAHRAEYTLQAPARFPELAVYLSNNSNSTIPESWDWRDYGALQVVKDQGYCGSCWAFASVANVESVWFLSDNPLPFLSEQQVVSCDVQDWGCDGGYMQGAFEYVMS